VPALDITRRHLRTVTLISVEGEIDLATEPTLRAALQPLPAEHLILDLTAVGFISAAGVRCLAETHDRLRRAHHTLVIIESVPVHRMTTITGLLPTLHTAPTRSAAHALLGAPVEMAP
jgi:anti-anti-sigma factor